MSEEISVLRKRLRADAGARLLPRSRASSRNSKSVPALAFTAPAREIIVQFCTKLLDSKSSLGIPNFYAAYYASESASHNALAHFDVLRRIFRGAAGENFSGRQGPCRILADS